MKKAEREKQQKAALKKRLRDIALGAYGGYELPDLEGGDFVGMAHALGLDAFGRWVGGIGHALLSAEYKYLIAVHNLEHFDDFEKAVEHLWSAGVKN